MDDQAIIDLYFSRSEHAIDETQSKYGRMLRSLSYGILRSWQDAEECENDTYLKAWNAMPPTRPRVLSSFLSKITRNLSLDRCDEIHALKRGAGEVPVLLDELSECIPDTSGGAEESLEAQELTDLINRYLGSMKSDARNIFMRRYWYGDSIREIADRSGYSLSKIKMSLSRSRKGLKALLEKEGRAV